MPKQYTASEFALPKVCGLAIHNAKNRQAGAINEYEKALDTSFKICPWEVQAYCLYGVNPDASVHALAGAPTSADFSSIIKRSNIAIFTDRDGFIGYVISRRITEKKQEWKTVSA
jgi:hypothetical protein